MGPFSIISWLCASHLSVCLQVYSLPFLCSASRGYLQTPCQPPVQLAWVRLSGWEAWWENDGRSQGISPSLCCSYLSGCRSDAAVTLGPSYTAFLLCLHPQLQGGVGFLLLLCFSALATIFVTNSLYEMTSTESRGMGSVFLTGLWLL